MADSGPTPPPPAPDANLSRTYVLVLVTETLGIAALYWISRRFS
jgi:hypothetical protein